MSLVGKYPSYHTLPWPLLLIHRSHLTQNCSTHISSSVCKSIPTPNSNCTGRGRTILPTKALTPTVLTVKYTSLELPWKMNEICRQQAAWSTPHTDREERGWVLFGKSTEKRSMCISRDALLELFVGFLAGWHVSLLNSDKAHCLQAARVIDLLLDVWTLTKPIVIRQARVCLNSGKAPSRQACTCLYLTSELWQSPLSLGMPVWLFWYLTLWPLRWCLLLYGYKMVAVGSDFSQVVWLIGCWLVSAIHK